MFLDNQIAKLGDDSFHWFFGVVEDNKDPLKLGRVRVRILGDHTQDKREDRIPTDGLPWAYHIITMPDNCMQGIGSSPTNLYQGTWIIGFYMDGPNKQMPIIFGSIGGVPRGLPPNADKITKKEKSQSGREISIPDMEIDKYVGFNDPNSQFPMGWCIFENDTNRLARGKQERAIEIPVSIVDVRESLCEDAKCPEKYKYAEQYIDEFKRKYVDKYDRDKDIDIKKKDDKQLQYILNNDHPFTVYKFINRQRFIPVAKVFEDPIHRDFWHEKLSAYETEYPYNKVWEGFHQEGGGAEYGYNQTITGYDGSMIEGIHRKQNCGIGGWGLGEEWDSTPANQRYHRFHPKGNYLEINKDGQEVRKIYGDNFEINVENKSIYVKGDWNVTVSGDKNELIEGDYNLQIMGDKNTDVRGNIKTHCENDNEWHFQGNNIFRVDTDDTVLIGNDRKTTILNDDYTESAQAERQANIILRKGAEKIEDEGFIDYKIKAHNMLFEVCNLHSQITDWESEITKLDQEIIDFDNTVLTYNQNITTFTENIFTHEQYKTSFTERLMSHTQHVDSHTEHVGTYTGCFTDWFAEVDDFYLGYTINLMMENIAEKVTCIDEIDVFIPPTLEVPIPLIYEEKATYPETEGTQQCLALYHECLAEAKASCTFTIEDTRLEGTKAVEDEDSEVTEIEGVSETRIDWEKYHVLILRCKEAYMKCIEANVDLECDICSPVIGSAPWEIICEEPEATEGSTEESAESTENTDPCDAGDKEIKSAGCKLKEEDPPPSEPKIEVIDPWKELNKEEV